MDCFDTPWTTDFPVGMIGIDLSRLRDVLSTKPVRFTVGAERAEFHLHEGLVSCLSAPLHALANRAPAAHLHDVDAAVFSCFAQFVYSGHYNPETIADNHEFVDDRMRTQRNMLLQHAQLWVFAQTYHVEPLKRAAHMQLTNELIISMMSPVTFFR
ncbi:hypothetical protein IF1G_10816 [Cordyceps javanica]|uniref:BTB domain-containing protein n=1 Tax=Cordyceps javanica TaxID=43265 RepID=A0A545VJG5_9HYPO|nr:hypothetical protein IF1G_10816 [Cordyceps javanica]TQW01871.1 hypothetical protein IF2G_10584 [Cordyceps javanica]